MVTGFLHLLCGTEKKFQKYAGLDRQWSHYSKHSKYINWSIEKIVHTAFIIPQIIDEKIWDTLESIFHQNKTYIIGGYTCKHT